MKKTLIIASILAAFGAHATGPGKAPVEKTPKATAAAQARQTTSVSTRVISSPSATATVSPGAVDMAGARIGSDQSMTVERSAPGVYGVATPPAADTCSRPGLSIGGSGTGGGGLLNIPTGESVKCDVRADALNLRYTGQPAEVVKARYCMDPQLAEAYARAGQPCRDARPQAGAPADPVATYNDPYIAARVASRQAGN